MRLHTDHGYTKPEPGSPGELKKKLEPAEILDGTTKNRSVIFSQYALNESYTSTNIHSQRAEERFSQLNKALLCLLTDLLTSLHKLYLIFSQLKEFQLKIPSSS